MTINIDKTQLKREIDKTPSKDLLVLTVSAFEKDPIKCIKQNTEKFLSRTDNGIVLILWR